MQFRDQNSLVIFLQEPVFLFEDILLPSVFQELTGHFCQCFTSENSLLNPISEYDQVTILVHHSSFSVATFQVYS